MANELPLSQLTADPAIHARQRLRPEIVRDYRAVAADRAGLDEMPPLVAFRDAEGQLWLSDGFHRYYAWQRAGHENVPVEILAGDRRAALLYACGANAEHGVQRTRHDKWSAVVLMLSEPDWAAMDDGWIAEKCAVSRTLVRQARKDCASDESLRDARSRRRGWNRKFKREQAAAAKARAESAAPPPPSQRALSPRERALEALARAQGAALGATRAATAADRAYPEATRMSAVAALALARGHLQDALPAAVPADLPSETGDEAGQAIAMLSQLWCGRPACIEPPGHVHAGETPAPQLGMALANPSVGRNQPATKHRAGSFQPATNQPATNQPATNQPATKQDAEPPPQEWIDAFREVMGGISEPFAEGNGRGQEPFAEGNGRDQEPFADPFDRLAAPPRPPDDLECLFTLSVRRETTSHPPPEPKPPPVDLVRQKKKDRKARDRARRAAESSQGPRPADAARSIAGLVRVALAVPTPVL